MTREKPLEQLKRELWLDRRLRAAGVPVSIHALTTDHATRTARARDAIEGHGLADKPAGRRAGDPRGKAVTFAQAFEIVFGEALAHQEAA